MLRNCIITHLQSIKCPHHIKYAASIILIMVSIGQNPIQIKSSIEIILINKLDPEVRQQILLIITNARRPLPASLTGELSRNSHIKRCIKMNFISN